MTPAMFADLDCRNQGGKPVEAIGMIIGLEVFEDMRAIFRARIR